MTSPSAASRPGPPRAESKGGPPRPAAERPALTAGRRLVGAEQSPEDERLDAALRPKSFDEFVGQAKVVRNLRVYIEAARARGERLDHVLLSGPPGLGKTTLAGIIARELGVDLRVTSGPALERAGDLVGLLTSLEGQALFIDEIHRLPVTVKEYLYAAMEDFVIDVVIDAGPAARSVRVNLPPFTLIGATTQDGLLAGPFRNRFLILERLGFYPPEEMERIAERSAGLLSVELDAAARTMLGARSRGTPRVINRFLRRIRDLAQVEGAPRLSAELVARGLEMLGVDAAGLDEMDRQILRAVRDHGGSGGRGALRPVGLKTIAVTVGEEERTIEEVYEPFLIQAGYLQKTPQGRLLSPRGVELIGGAPAAADEPRLF